MARFLSPFVVFIVFAAASELMAASPSVRFDVAQTTHASDVSDAEFLAANPGAKLVHIRLPISSLVDLRDETSLVQYLYFISGPASSSFQIVDYAPKTTLASDVAGPISVEQKSGDATNIGINAEVPHDALKANASATRNHSSSNSQRLQQLPPKYLLSASGTMHRGTAAYFKLRPSSQTTLEGDKVFEVTASVPYNWRAGLLHIHCVASNRTKSVTHDSDSVCGENRFVVGVYMSGDEVAKQSVSELAAKQQQLQSLAAEHAEVIADRRFPTIGHKLGAALSVTKPKIPDQWLEQLLLSNEFHDFERHLPRTVRSAANQYREARKHVFRFAG